MELQALTPEMLVAKLPGVPLKEARKVIAQVFRDEPVHPTGMVSARVANLVNANATIPALSVDSEQRSALDPFRKYVLKTPDGALLETVRIPLEKQGRFSVCVSSQVGCALACAFCATGRMGLIRNLHTWEMVDQVRVVARGLREEKSGRVHGVVFQGMGEPMTNLDRVIAAIRVLSDPCTLAIDQRAMTVSTSGIPAGILRLANEVPNVRLALSLHAARVHVRKSLMPIQDAHPLDDVIEASVEHARITGYAPLWAVTPLAGVNDSDEDARAIASLAQDFERRSGVRPRISVIPYNRIGDDAQDPFRRVDDDGETRFRAAMAEQGTFTHKRYSGGHDVGAACGQLANATTRASIGR